MKKIFYSTCTFLLLTIFGFGQQNYRIQLVKDINPGPLASNSKQFINFNNKLYFTAQDLAHGNEFWSTDGTFFGTQMALDVNPGSESASPMGQIVFNDKLFFVSGSANEGREIWFTDGTQAGTHILKDIYPGIESSNPRNFIIYNDKLYFVADDGVHGAELWTSDGTEAGTYMLKDIRVGDATSGSFITGFIVFDGKLFFGATDSSNSSELWTSDGTEEGTELFADINPGAGSSNPRHFCISNNQLFFQALKSGSGFELWVTDGTVSGTRMVKDILIGGGSSLPSNLISFNNKLYFTANAVNLNGALPVWWCSDGTEAGTTYVPASSNLIGYINTPVVFENKLFYKGNTSQYGYQLCSIDANNVVQIYYGHLLGSNQSTLPNDPLNVSGGGIHVFNNELFISAVYNSNLGVELYKFGELKTTLTSPNLNSINCENESKTFTGNNANEYEFLINDIVVQSRSTNSSFTTSDLANNDVVKVKGYLVNNAFFGADSITVTVLSIDNSVNLVNNTLTAVQTDAVYNWVGCNSTSNPVTNASNQSFEVEQSGEYAVEITMNGCLVNSSCISVDLNTNLSIQANIEDQFKIYPNPTSGLIHIDFNSFISNGVIFINDLSGRTVYNTEIDKTSVEIQLECTAGVYLLYIQTPEETIVKSIQIK